MKQKCLYGRRIAVELSCMRRTLICGGKIIHVYAQHILPLFSSPARNNNNKGIKKDCECSRERVRMIYRSLPTDLFNNFIAWYACLRRYVCNSRTDLSLNDHSIIIPYWRGIMNYRTYEYRANVGQAETS